ncbi:MAG: DUF1877 family protein [Agrococcus sp.]
MGIRYYAYAFDAEATERALADPRSMVSDDPLADAWGLPHGFTVGTTDFQQSVPQRDLLYLDKAWPLLQALTAPGPGDSEARPAHRMFEGRVTSTDTGWHAWVRALSPDEVVDIARDLAPIDSEQAAASLRAAARSGADPDAEAQYGAQHLGAASTFVSRLAAEGRGMVYMIG